MKNYIQYIVIAIIIFSWGLNIPYCEYYRCDSFFCSNIHNHCLYNYCVKYRDVHCCRFCDYYSYDSFAICFQSCVFLSTCIVLICDSMSKKKYNIVLDHYEKFKIKYIRENGSRGSSKLYQEAICYAADCIYKSDCYTSDEKEYINKKMLQDLNDLERKEKTTYSNVIVY